MEGPFLSQHGCTPTYKASSIKTRFDEFVVKELNWYAQSSDFNPTKHFWDELEWQL